MTAAVLYQTMPPLSVEEYATLEQSIREHGIQVPIIIDENGVVIDGHHRQKIAATLDVYCPMDMKEGLTEAEKRALSITLNIDRRQLSREQRRSIIESSVKAAPELSNRQHAELTGTHKNTVQAVRDELESTGQIAQSATRVSADGRERPATQPERPVVKVTETHKEESYVDTSTGEVVEEPPAPARSAKPVPTGDAANQVNAETMSKEIGQSLAILSLFANASHRERVLTNWWPLGQGAVPPISRDLFNPAELRQIAESLEHLATELESADV